MKKILLSLLAIVLAITAKADVTDVLNQSVTGVTGTSYTDFSGKYDKSYAVYAGQCAGANGSIQLRTKNSNEGVVSTTSGGKLKQIIIEWNENTAFPTEEKPENTRTLQIYGKNEAYSTPTELFDEEKKGTLIGEVTYDGVNQSVTITVEGDYTYVGFCSKSSALYLNSVSITWDGEARPGGGEDPVDPQPSIINTHETPYTPAQANAFALAGYTDAVFVKGVITSISSLDTSKYTNARYYIGETVDAEETFYIFNGKYLQGLDFTSDDQIKVGDEVIVYGELTVYNGTPEFGSGNYIYSLNGETEPPTPTVAAPAFSLDAGTYGEPQELTITGPKGYGLIYTTDGSTPEDGNGTYVTDNTVTITISETTTVKAIAVDNNDPDFTSSVVSVSITITQTYTSIADLKAATTATSSKDAPTVNFQFENLIVTGAAGQYVYVTDGTEGYLLYGSNSGMEKGDIISGTISGQPYKYNGLNEMSVQKEQWANVTKAENKAEVTPVDVTVAEVITEEGMAKYESMYIRLTNVTFKAGAINLSDVLMQDGNEVTIYNTLKDADISALSFSTTQPYNVNVFLAIRNGAAQVYPLSADFFDFQTDLETPISYWTIGGEESIDTYFLKENYERETIQFKTNSDAAPVFTSSNEAVAFVSEDGNLIIAKAGIATITATTAETGKYLPSSATITIYCMSDAEGTAEKPYTPADVQILYTRNEAPEAAVWVKGIIVGNVNTQKGTTVVPETAEDAAATNLSLEVDGYNIAVQLPVGDIRTALNLKDNFNLIGKEVLLLGTIEKYCGTAGLKNLTDAILDGISVGIDSIAVNPSTAKSIYTLSGQKVRTIQKGGIYIVDGKKMYVK